MKKKRVHQQLRAASLNIHFPEVEAVVVAVFAPQVGDARAARRNLQCSDTGTPKRWRVEQPIDGQFWIGWGRYGSILPTLVIFSLDRGLRGHGTVVWNLVLFGQPGTKIDQPAAIAAKRPKG